MMGGACDGGGFVDKLFNEQMWGTCRDCMLSVYVEEEGAQLCQVLTGQEPTRECPELADLIRYEGIKLYGVNKPPEKRSCLRFRR